METKGLLFIPDISGFTKFVNETSIDHSRLIIQELLQILIDSNRLNLQVSEIEGDAILFYKFGEAPSLEDLYRQVSEMFQAFHRQRAAYEYRRFCQCEACQSAVGLTLKVITHYGEFTGYSISSFHKLIGRDIIVAHRLLKNSVDAHEYWLVTNKLIGEHSLSSLPSWMSWNSSQQLLEGGEVGYQYATLTRLREDIPSEILPDPQLSKKKLIVTRQREYEVALIPLFHACGDFRYRSQWQDGVKAVEEVDHVLPRLGMRCRLLRANGDTRLFYTSYSFSPELIEFTETEEKSNATTRYTLEKISEGRTRLCIDYLIPASPFNWLIISRRKKQVAAWLEQSMENLDPVARSIHLPK